MMVATSTQAVIAEVRMKELAPSRTLEVADSSTYVHLKPTLLVLHNGWYGSGSSQICC